MKTNQAVRYDHFGHSDVLHIVETPKPEAGAGEVLVKIKTAGINPGEASIREGKMEKMFPSTFPSGQGTDFAGIVEAVGGKAGQFKAGDEVIGFTNERNAQADYVVVKEDQLVYRPANVSWEVAGGLFVAGTTAYAAVKAVSLKDGDTVIVSGAAGGVGAIAVQLAKKQGVTVVGLASEPHHEWLSDHGIIPALYHGDTQKNIEEALNGKKADAFIDTSGKGYVAMAVYMDIPPDRINTIIDFDAAKKYKVKTDGNAAAGNADVLQELSEMVDKGELEIPIAGTYPLSDVASAYDELEQHHTLGKIVLVTSAVSSKDQSE
ncbi:NADPH:quinone reductase [Mucilaginibacter gossypiicola]|uniref:NADPH:quinone reductase n=1 Tax=Mucilaginibacter gossypiicola TaxID=551995 RepID=A0A1H8M0K6_9SPHI|nr:NADP-dependent oxidoreductase [Mucilaginibacter gossypiicola]SEO10922.1 NADPH:quinone reductase [Mucilaginibacter gossypiicola]